MPPLAQLHHRSSNNSINFLSRGREEDNEKSDDVRNMQSRSGFLFVNKDSNSAKLTQSNGSEKAKIFRHVRPRPLHRKTSRRKIFEKDGQKREKTASAEGSSDGSVIADHASRQVQVRKSPRVDHLSPLSSHASAMTAAADHLLRICKLSFRVRAV